MLNNYNVNNSQSINLNSVSGTIVKNYKESFIMRSHMKSQYAETLF